VKLPILIALKVQLYIMLRESGITRAELSRRLGWHREQVDRLFRLDHASRLDRLEAAFKALHRELDVEIRDASIAAGGEASNADIDNAVEAKAVRLAR
jgi:antitoxin HicB